MINYDNTPTGDVTLKAPASGTTTFQFPSSAGAAGRPLITDGSGVMSWNDQAVLTTSGVTFDTLTATTSIDTPVLYHASPISVTTDLVVATGKELQLPANGLRLSDASESGGLVNIYIVDPVANCGLGFKTNNVNRSVDIQGDAILSGTNTGDQTTISGNSGTATALQTSRTIGGSSFDGTANVTSFPSPGAIGGTTPAAGTFTSVTAIAASTQDAINLSPRAGGTGSFTASLTTTTLTANRTVTFPDATGTVVLGGGTCSGVSSGTNTGDQTTISGNAGTATALQTARSIYGNNFDGSASLTGNAVINQLANGDTAIKSTRATDTSPTGNFLDFQTVAAASVFKVDRFGALTVNITAQTSTAERLLTFGVSDSGSSFTLDNGTTNANFFNPTFNGIIEPGVEGVPISFFGTKGVDGSTNPAILFLYRRNTGGGNTDLSSTVTGVEFRNRATKGFGFTGGHNFQLCGSATLAAATASVVSQAGVDNGGNREWQLQPAAGGFLAFGNNKLRRVPTANQDVYDWFPTVNTTDNTVTTLATIPITAGRTYMIEARVVARRTGGSSGTAEDGASYCRRATYTTKSGTVTLMGSVQTIGTDAEDQAGWDVTLTISSTNVLVRVTGATNNNVTWMGDIKIQSVAS